ncbi:type II secretion system minor pseudopilin GspI [Pseudomonas sp. NIBRBAC000502773]|uniref:type II secretion system minor pseudopilin GspI n=1 Tax=Pseudomonas sp. NIBRBAC000502773 TaxID=2590776 RepID=UPI001130D040|nr:type II secretion system minor pseudopilin GspI [Pseudomonas sp. NIBRBAC000502773]QDG60086.1 type II secretion system protein GspI [Pseudomonas sp. NIBRBAC000502773]
MYGRRKEQGFTLIEVLVALAIIAVAMAAAIRVAGLMTQGDGLLRDKSMGLLAAQSRLAELRLEGHLRDGTKTFSCDQGRLKLRCEQTISRDGRLFQVNVQVLDASREAPPLARVETQVRAE